MARAKSAARKPPARKAAAPRKNSARKPAARPRRRRTAPKNKAAARGAGVMGQESTYSSTTFRSQLEARWAIFFDCLGLDWDYEPCHYPLGDGLGYLPDFYLPTLGLWAEGKGPTFLDRHAMGKVINAVAGPQPLPLREPPYWPNNGLLLLGPMLDIPDIGRPVHTLFLAHGQGTAGAWRSVWEASGVQVVGKKPWLTFPAGGTSPARRPTPARTAQLLTPVAEPSAPLDPMVRAAYRVALETTFDPKGAAVLPKAAVRSLSHRRRGRPLRPQGAEPTAIAA